ncbi:hypothetical protein EASAB2608_03299 [Streptomyces sp. EAS-AB2608]|uniref:Uncharacterized protein n=1 Tax=Streptomyces bangladeshensis TaxID=295352 RepID=A0ABN3BBW6_9ACTN|nr:hypothetical protein EASAB2608_03299 [Streptomyces sp. EAS-AB2608]
MRLEGVAAGQHQTVRPAGRDDVREQPAMGFGDVHGKIFRLPAPAARRPTGPPGEILAAGGNVPPGGGH